MTGVLVSFLGIDGIGKSTTATALADRLRAAGADVVATSWRGALADSAHPWPGQALQQLWLETYRCLYGAGRLDGRPVSLPRDFETWESGRYEEALGRAAVDDNAASGPLAAALVELAGNVVLAAEVIAPARRRGAVVILETFPFKHVVKEILIARRLASSTAPAQGLLDLVDEVHAFLRVAFGSPLLRPDVGMLVDGPIELAYRWRCGQSGSPGALEDFKAAGLAGWESFRDLQTQTSDAFRSLARDWDWLVHRVDDSGLSANVERAVALLATHPALVPWLAGGGQRRPADAAASSTNRR